MCIIYTWHSIAAALRSDCKHYKIFTSINCFGFSAGYFSLCVRLKFLFISSFFLFFLFVVLLNKYFTKRVLCLKRLVTWVMSKLDGGVEVANYQWIILRRSKRGCPSVFLNCILFTDWDCSYQADDVMCLGFEPHLLGCPADDQTVMAEKNHHLSWEWEWFRSWDPNK